MTLLVEQMSAGAQSVPAGAPSFSQCLTDSALVTVLCVQLGQAGGQ